jgi:uncharacterized protein involved in exopolysaccharide biosynthesis
MATALALVIVAVIAGVLTRFFVDKLNMWMACLTKRLLRIAIKRLSEAQRERFSEEWASHINEVTGQISKVAVALGCISAAQQMASSSKPAEPVLTPMLIRGGGMGYWFKQLLVPVLIATLGAYLTYLVADNYFAKYTSQSTILVEAQTVPENMVQPIVSADLGARMATLQQQVMSQINLQPVVERVFPVKNSQQVGEIIDNIRLNMTVQQVPTDLLQLGAEKKPGAQGNSGGFYVSYTAPNAREAEQICTELTSLMLNENLKSLQAAAKGTRDVLSKGIEVARRNLEDLGIKLASLKKQRGRESVSPDVEEFQQKLLTIDYDSAVKNYEELLAKKNAADLTLTMTNMAAGEQMALLAPANLPDAPEFPNLWAFIGFGSGFGLSCGIFRVLWIKFRSGFRLRKLQEGSSTPH